MELRNFRDIVLPSNFKLADITPVDKKTTQRWPKAYCKRIAYCFLSV